MTNTRYVHVYSHYMCGAVQHCYMKNVLNVRMHGTHTIRSIIIHYTANLFHWHLKATTPTPWWKRLTMRFITMINLTSFSSTDFQLVDACKKKTKNNKLLTFHFRHNFFPSPWYFRRVEITNIIKMFIAWDKTKKKFRIFFFVQIYV